MFIVYLSFKKSLEERKGEMKYFFWKSSLNSLSVGTTAVNQILPSQTQAKSYCLKLSRIGDNHI